MNRPSHTALEAMPRRVLLVDDSRAQRMVISARLRKWGFSVSEAGDGAEALDLLRRERFPLVISDWIMPELSGPELCRALREREDDRRAYFVLLTSKQGKEDVSAGLSAGADDFLTKPVDEGELQARLQAGLRLIDMQERLVDRNLQVTQAYNEVRTLYERIDADLRAAATLQHAFLPPARARCNGFGVNMYYNPAGHVGGDLVGYFPIDDTRLGLFSIDVSGHGVASSLLTIRLAQLFNPGDPRAGVAFSTGRRKSPKPPHVVVRELNEAFLAGDTHDLYFTIVYGILDSRSRRFRFCQAGHAHPLLIPPRGEPRFAGEGGPPVGLLPDLDFSSASVRMAPGERLLLYSDGVTEAEGPAGTMLGEEGVRAAAARFASADDTTLNTALVAALGDHVRGGAQNDDVSWLLVSLPGGADQGPGRSPQGALRSAPRL